MGKRAGIDGCSTNSRISRTEARRVAPLTGVWRDLPVVAPPQAPDLRELFVEEGFCAQV
jgi:hypothetical protein